MDVMSCELSVSPSGLETLKFDIFGEFDRTCQLKGYVSVIGFLSCLQQTA